MKFSDFLILNEIEEDIFEIDFIGSCYLNEARTTRAVGIKSIYTDPTTGKRWRHRSRFQQLEEIAKNEEAKGTNRENIWVSFSLVPKLGINPQASDGSTPLGIYAYPIDYIIKYKAKGRHGDNDYGSERPFMIVFKVIRDNLLTIKRSETSEITNLQEIIRIMNQTDFREFLSKKHEQVNRIIEKYTRKIDDYQSREAFRYYLNEKADNIFSRIRLQFTDSEGTSLEKLKSINVDEAMSQGFEEDLYTDMDKEEVRKKIIEIIPILDIDGHYNPLSHRKKYGDIDPETLSAKLSSYYQNYWGNSKTADSFVEILKNYAFRYDYKKLGRTWLFLHSPIAKVVPLDKIKKLLEILKTKIKQLIAEYEEKYSKFGENVKFPLDKELKQFAQENNLDWFKALHETLPHLSGNESTTGHFLYNYTRSLARQMSNKTNRKYYVIWTSILKKLGLSGISDEFGTGTIYGGEPTQGVFFDARQAQLIAVVENRSHIDPRDLSGRPGEGAWSYSAHKHHYEIDPKRQRQGILAPWEPEDNAVVRSFKGLIQKSSQIRDTLESVTQNEKDTNKHLAALSQLVILVKAFGKIDKLLDEEHRARFKLNIQNFLEHLKTIGDNTLVPLMGKKKAARVRPYYEKVQQFLEYYVAKLSNIPPEEMPPEIKLSPRDFMLKPEEIEEDKEYCAICGLEVKELSYYKNNKFYCYRHWESSEWGENYEWAKKTYIEHELKCSICQIAVQDGTSNFVVDNPDSLYYAKKKYFCPKHWELSKQGTDVYSAKLAYQQEEYAKQQQAAVKEKEAQAKVQQTADPAVMKAALKSKIKQIKKKELKAAAKQKYAVKPPVQPLQGKLDIPPAEPEEADYA